VVHPQSASGNSTTAGAVEQDSALSVTVQNVAIAPDNTVEQLAPPATSTSLQPLNAQLEPNNPSLERLEEELAQAIDLDGDENEELEYDGKNNVLLGHDNHQEGHNEHRCKWNQYILEKAMLMGTTVTKGQGVKAITWKVCGDISDDDLPPGINEEYREVGIHGFDFMANSTRSYKDALECTNLMSLLIHLWPGDWITQIQRVNDIINKKNDENSAKIQKIGTNQQARLRMRIKHISEREFWIFWGIIVAACIHGRFGDLWDIGWLEGQRHKVDYSNFMKQYQFQQIWEAIVHMWASLDRKEDDNWWMISHTIDEFNTNHKCCISPSLMKTMDESNNNNSKIL